MTARRQVRVALACVALAVPLAVAVPIASSGATIAGTDQLVGVQGLPALPKGAVPDGVEPAGAHLSMRVVLSPKDPAALSGFIAAVSSPSSPTFRRYLARGQFTARFGPTSQAIATVRGLLRHDGLAVTSLSPSHLVLTVSGSAARFAAALHAPLERLRLAGGSLGYRLERAARLPGGVARYVSGVVGVASVVRERSFARRPTARSQRPHAAVRATSHAVPRLAPGGPCLAAQSALDTLPGTLTPTEEGQAYGLTTAWGHGDDGTGHTV
jgi:subtilase family serine protease